MPAAAADHHSVADAAPSDALMELLAPDGYYKYLEVAKPSLSDVLNTQHQHQKQPDEKDPTSPTTTTIPLIDEDYVKKQYRKLSRKHHPDKPGGDADTFRLLNRAQRVLLNPKLRQQYDILGIDLDDEEDDMQQDDHQQQDGGDGDDPKSSSSSSSQQQQQSTAAQGIIQEIAAMALTTIMQLTVRTVLMGAVSILVVRYRIFLYPALLFLCFIGYRIVQTIRMTRYSNNSDDCASALAGSFLDVLSPISIAVGLLCMHYGRRFVQVTADGVVVDPELSDPAALGEDATLTTTWEWTWLFWLGEAIVIGLFTFNSVSSQLPPQSMPVFAGIGAVSLLLALWFRGQVWNYAIVVGLEVFLALLVALAFPIVEFILEAILNEKLRKVGDRVRVHHEYLTKYYNAKLERLAKESSNTTATTAATTNKR